VYTPSYIEQKLFIHGIARGYQLVFFNCCVAEAMRLHLSEINGCSKIANFESMGTFWIGGKYIALNVCYSAVIWTMWKARNRGYVGRTWRAYWPDVHDYSGTGQY
jgi:hypothetical protein